MRSKIQAEEKMQAVLSNNLIIMAICIIADMTLFCLFNYIAEFTNSAINSISCMITTFEMPSFTMPKISSMLNVNENLFFLYIILLVLLAVIDVKLVYKIKTSFTTINNGQKGEREFSTVEELKKQYKSIPEKDKEYKGSGGVLISRFKDRIFIDDSPVNNLVIGTTRSGKGETFVVPCIDIYSRAKNKPSMVINDCKGELVGASKEVLESRGYDIKIMDLVDFMGLSYNPLEIIKESYMRGDKAESQLLARTFSFILFNEPNAKDKTWQNWSISLTNALIMAHVIDCVEANEIDKINMYSVTNLLINLGQKQMDEQTNQLDKFFNDRPLDDIARIQYSSVAFAQGKLKGNIYANTLAKLEIFTYDNVARMTSRNNVSLVDIGYGDKPQAVFMVVPDYDCSNHFLSTVFISQLYYVSSKKASKTKGNKCTREIVFMLDEFGNMPGIPDMSNIITVCLGRNMRFNLIVQAYSQLDAKYGKENSKTIVGNCGNQIYLLTNELETAQHFSQLIGNETITVKNRTSDGILDMNKKITEHIDTKPLLNPNDLMELIPGESAVVRVMKRQDKRGKKVKPKPIFNTDDTMLKFRYEYLTDFDTSNTLFGLNLSETCEHKDVIITNIVYMPLVDLLESDYEFVELPIGNQKLQDVVKADVLDNIAEIIGVDNNYGNMTSEQLRNFIKLLADDGNIDENAKSRAFTYIDKLLTTNQRLEDDVASEDSQQNEELSN